MALAARRTAAPAATGISRAALERLVRFPAVRARISSGLSGAVKAVDFTPGFVSFRLADPGSFHPALFATIPIGKRGTLLTIGTPCSAVKKPRELARFLARMGWDARSRSWNRRPDDQHRRSLLYQLRSAGIIGGAHTQRVLVPRARVEAAVRAVAPTMLRKAAGNPVYLWDDSSHHSVYAGVTRSWADAGRIVKGILRRRSTEGKVTARAYGAVGPNPRTSRRNPVEHVHKEGENYAAQHGYSVWDSYADRATAVAEARWLESGVVPGGPRNAEALVEDWGSRFGNKRWMVFYRARRAGAVRNPILATLGFNPPRRTRRNPWDAQTEKHFYSWLARTVPDDEMAEVERGIHRLLRDHPELLETHSWPEMRRLAETMKNPLTKSETRYIIESAVRSARAAKKFPAGSQMRTFLAGDASGQAKASEFFGTQRSRSNRLVYSAWSIGRPRGDAGQYGRVRERAITNPSSHPVPGITKWNMYAGGTAAAEGKHSFDLYLQVGRYLIDPISSKYGRHIGYVLHFLNEKGTLAGGIWQQISPGIVADIVGHSGALHRSPQSAASSARKHYDAHFAVKANRNPLRKRPRELSVFDRHQLRIAHQTLKMNDVGASIMGGMTKEEARAIILRFTGRPAKENPLTRKEAADILRESHRFDRIAKARPYGFKGRVNAHYAGRAYGLAQAVEMAGPKEAQRSAGRLVYRSSHALGYGRNPASGPVDKDAARELELFVENDGDLHRSQVVPIIQNLMRKRAKGIFDFEKSVKLWQYLIDAGAKKYIREYVVSAAAPRRVPNVDSVFNKNTRVEVARRFAQHFVTEANLGNYDHHLTGKYMHPPSDALTNRPRRHGASNPRALRWVVYSGGVKGKWVRIAGPFRSTEFPYPAGLISSHGSPQAAVRAAERYAKRWGYSLEAPLTRGNPLTDAEAERSLDRARWSLIMAKKLPKGSPERSWHAGRGSGQASVVHDRSEKYMLKARQRLYEADKINAAKTSALSNLAPAFQQINVPFRDGQKIPPTRMRAWLVSLPNGPVKNLMSKRFEHCMKQYSRFHLGSEPTSFTYKNVPMGAQTKKIVDVDFVVSEGKEWAAPYQVPKSSAKYQKETDGRYIHSHGESGVDVTIKHPKKFSQLPERFHTPDGKHVGVIPGRVSITDWYRK